jgi:hypothetical protein
MFTRTLSEAKTMRRPCGGMRFSAGEPGLVQKENSSDGQRHRQAHRIISSLGRHRSDARRLDQTNE